MEQRISEDVYIVTELAKEYGKKLKEQNVPNKEIEYKMIEFIKLALLDYQKLSIEKFSDKYGIKRVK